MHLRLSLALALGLVLSAAVAACSGGHGTTGGGGGPDAGSDAPSGISLRVEPAMTSVVVTLGVPPSPVAFKAFAKGPDNVEIDVTMDADWSADPKIASLASGGNVNLSGVGGKGTVTATYKGIDATAALTVKLTGDVFAGGADMTTKAGFDGASADPDPANAPVVEYPANEVVLPANLPPIEAQWTQASDNAAYRVSLTAPDVLDVTFYTTMRELLFPADAWSAILASTPDTTLDLTVAGLGGGGKLVRTGQKVAVTVAADSIEDSAIYVWQSSSGSFRVLDIIKGTDIPLPNDSPALSQGQPCSGCHRISRDGKRFSYTYNGGNFEFGTLVYDPQKAIFTSKISPTPNVRGTYATFNPLESSTRAAMLVTLPDNVPQNTPGTVHIDVVDPDTNMQIPSDFAAMVGMIDPAVGHATMMPDWSPDGNFVVFAAYNSDANYVRLLGDDVVLASIVEAPVSYTGGKFTFGAPKVLVKTPGADPDSGENNLLPTISPDGAAVAFTRASGWWSIKTQQSLINRTGRISLVRRSDGTVFDLKGGANPPGMDQSNTWPQWAPSAGQKYMWLAFGSERPYGHRLTEASPENAVCTLVQGQKQCKHLWIMAIDRAKLMAGAEDPSAQAFYIPGQTLAAQYVSPQWTRAVLPQPK